LLVRTFIIGLFLVRNLRELSCRAFHKHNNKDV
jgi:hypothetical protein